MVAPTDLHVAVRATRPIGSLFGFTPVAFNNIIT